MSYENYMANNKKKKKRKKNMGTTNLIAAYVNKVIHLLFN